MPERVLLYTKVPPVSFTASQAGELESFLRHADDKTMIVDIAREEDIMITPKGRTRTGYRFTRGAFSQLASLLSPGLSRCLPELSGTAVAAKSSRFVADECIALWNAVVIARFGSLQSHRLLLNASARRIEGVIGPKHKYLGNYDFYREVSDLLLSTRRDYQTRFYAARVFGGRFSLWFRDAAPAFRIDTPDMTLPFYEGRYFANGEAAGTAVRGTLAIFSSTGVALGGYSSAGAKLSHTGKRFHANASNAVRQIIEIAWDREKAKEQAETALLKSLGFSATMKPQQRKDRRALLVNTLGLAGVPKSTARDLLIICLRFGRRYSNESVPEHYDEYDGTGRLLLDLYVPLQALARRASGVARERLEQASYDMITNQFIYEAG